MAFAHVERHVELLPDLGLFMRVDAGDEGVPAGVLRFAGPLQRMARSGPRAAVCLLVKKDNSSSPVGSLY